MRTLLDVLAPDEKPPTENAYDDWTQIAALQQF